jgi:hypothetical protein
VKKLIKIIVVLIFVGSICSGCKIDKEQLQNKIKVEFQNKMDTDEMYAAYKIQTNTVTLVSKGQNIYDGIVNISLNEKSYDVLIEVTADGDSAIWQTKPLAFAFLTDMPTKSEVETLTIEKLQNMYIAYLREMGYQPEINRNGLIVFRTDDGSFLIYPQIIVDNPGYFFIEYPGMFEIDKNADNDLYRRIFGVCLMYQGYYSKGARYSFDSQSGSISILSGSFVGKPEEFDLYFNMVMESIIVARDEFFSVVK